jgi:hypothetical protein
MIAAFFLFFSFFEISSAIAPGRCWLRACCAASASANFYTGYA